MQARLDHAGFIRGQTEIATSPLVPELRLHLATEVTPLWQATERLLQDAQLPPPFWAFAWPGGQALARYLLDNPATVAGRRVIDVGAGSGIGSIAAATAGAADVVAFDLDPFACAAIALNAELNRANVTVRMRDITAGPASQADCILAGDICYERAAADRIAVWLRKRAGEGMLVLLGDPGRSYMPKDGLEPLARYTVPTSRELEDRTARETGVWRLLPGECSVSPASA